MPIEIATHNGPFHADDAMAVALMRLVHPDAAVVRSRDPGRLQRADVRLDVGGRADPATGDYDHHFAAAPRRAGHPGSDAPGTPLAATGLVWQQHAQDILRALQRPEGSDGPPAAAETSAGADRASVDLRAVAAWVDQQLLEPVDALDNGVPVASAEQRLVSNAAHAWNLTWEEQLPLGRAAMERENTERFRALGEVLEVGLRGLFTTLLRSPRAEWPGALAAFRSALTTASAERLEAERRAAGAARTVVATAIRESPGPVLRLPSMALPWGEHYHELALAADRIHGHAVGPASDGVWMCQTVPESPGSFTSRAMFPLAWAGLRGGELERASGLSQAVFCHAGRWLSGWRTADAAMQAARAAWQELEQATGQPVPEVALRAADARARGLLAPDARRHAPTHTPPAPIRTPAGARPRG